ncbi:nickel pincer cofactor biosynthesis protein LarC [Pseudonocardia bannensis]|uniref:Pyridinium-3,5-bisthiocarboxylic acid mononucleotide nickel insertion protein n=1 Tax=Pseudonocardia bannensis TaxID=630973 RepID=A0A848DME0_9PSEU|nr:nickel pincer cofactor biosynthesis protein LarC [Pseudonocardia bannensis]NMH93950.1 nickel pincer cofactor biosynthesis protein LarC [Pseudonocardia bannensis]
MILWLNPFSGISGDMLLGALLDLGAPLQGVRDAVAATGLTGWDLTAEPAPRGALVATRARVAVHDTATERPAAALLEMIARARPAPVAELAARAVRAIAEVEGRLHGVPVDAVHLHEIGGADTVVDTVGVAAALHLLDVRELHCGPLALGSGTVQTRHGTLPLPAPATAALLAAAGAPVTSTGSVGETVTPTGIALLLAAGARFGPVPEMTVRAAGYGAGGRDAPERPNVLPALLGTGPVPGSAGSSPMVHLESNVDDVTGEVLGHLVERLLAAGAADAWITPIVMKKSRPAHTVHVLADPARAGECERIVLRETGSLGLRRSTVDRLALPRSTVTVEVDGQPIRVKSGPWGAKPEHDDVAAAAAVLGLPLRAVAERALRRLDPGP